MTDYTKIEASPVFGTIIGRSYMDASPFVTTLARQAYRSLADQVDGQFFRLATDYGLDVRFEWMDPYADAQEMFAEINRGVLRINRTTTDQSHPLLSDVQNDRFRAVHDFHGHYMTGRGFDRHGEEAAWVRHSMMFKGLGRRAMTTETRGQNSAMNWINEGEFPPQKAVLLPDWMTDIPAQWR